MPEEINTLFNYIDKSRISTLEHSPYFPMVSVNLNQTLSVSFIFCGQKAFDCSIKKDNYLFQLKNDFFEMINSDNIPFPYDIKNIKSLSEYTRIFLPKQEIYFKEFTDYIFTFIETYIDIHYIPDYTYDCCHRYMECSDVMRCTNPDIIHSKSCTYKSKLESGIIFFGKNRNI